MNAMEMKAAEMIAKARELSVKASKMAKGEIVGAAALEEVCVAHGQALVAIGEAIHAAEKADQEWLYERGMEVQDEADEDKSHLAPHAGVIRKMIAAKAMHNAENIRFFKAFLAAHRAEAKAA